MGDDDFGINTTVLEYVATQVKDIIDMGVV